MIHVSDKFKESLQYGHNFHEEVEVNFKDGRTILLDQEIMLSGNSFIDGVGSSSFPVGLVICKSLTLSIDNRDERFKNYDFFGAKLKPVIKLLLDDGTTEKIKKGTYTVTEPENYGEIIDITAMDDAYRLDKPYHTSLVFPQSLFALVSDACSTCDIPMKFSSMEHGDFVINSVPSDMTFRSFLGYTAQIESANARIDTDGYLDFIKWDFVATEYHELKNFKNTPIVSTGNYTEFRESVESQFSVLADQINLVFTNTNEAIQAVDGDLQSKFQQITTFFTFDIDGFTIGKEDSPYKIFMTNERYSMQVNGVEVLWIDAVTKAAYFPSMTITERFTIIGYVITMDENGNLNCDWGGEE